MNLIILKSAPSSDLEALELVLACAAFEQPVSILLIDHAIQHAIKTASSIRSDSKSIKKIFSALPMYDCEQIYVCQKSLKRSNLDEACLHDFCAIVDSETSKKLIASASKTVAF